MVVLPLAWITGEGISDRAADRLFQITGQTVPWDEKFIFPWVNAGFRVSVEKICRETWEVVIIIAEKVCNSP
jgi:hypothetical protein